MTTNCRHAVLATLWPLALAATLLSPPARADAVHEGFDRLLDHPVTQLSAAHPSGERDPLLGALVEPLRDGRAPAARSADLDPARVPDDAVGAAFARMLAHAPAPLRAAVPAGTDPLHAALVEPLRDGHRGSAPAVYASAVAAGRR